MITPPPESRLARYLAYALLAGLAVVVFLVFRDYGISNDEEVQNTYGQLLLRYYASGFTDRSALNYIDLYRYGGAFDMACAALNLVSPFGEYETRHLLGGLVGILGLWGAFAFGRHLGGDRVGLLALLLLLLTPAFIGHSFINPKDAPFATAMLWSLYAIALVLEELPRPSWRAALGFGAAFGMAISVRVGAVLLVPYLGFGIVLHLLLRWRAGASWRELACALWTINRRLLPALVLAYGVMAAFWPYAYQAPLNPWRALSQFSHLPIDLETLANGVWYPATALPDFYLPAYFLITLPELVLLGLVFALGYGLAWLRQPRTADHRPLVVAVLALAGTFPVVYAIAAHTTAYNGLRHFLFVVPPLVLVAACGLDRLLRHIAGISVTAGRAFAFALGAALLGQAGIVVYLHPYEYTYYNALVGGTKGAEDRWDMDYWGLSLREAVLRLADVVRAENEGEPIRRHYKVAVCGKEESAIYDFPPFLVFEEKWDRADFLIALTHDGCDRELPLPNLIVVERFGAPFVVVRDLRGQDLP